AARPHGDHRSAAALPPRGRAPLRRAREHASRGRVSHRGAADRQPDRDQGRGAIEHPRLGADAQHRRFAVAAQSRARRRRDAGDRLAAQLSLHDLRAPGSDVRAPRGHAMNFIEQLRSLDTNDPGRWPLPFRVAAVVITFVLVAVGGVYWFVVKTDMQTLDRRKREEQELRATFEQKQRKAANFDAYREQLAEIERSFGTMLRQLPGRTEVPSLLVDISQTGLAAGLEEKLFQPTGEIQ